MKIYTKSGDGGMTSLANSSSIPKSDDRIELVGTIDELTSHLGLIKAKALHDNTKTMLVQIQKNLMTIMSGISDSHNMKYKLKDEELSALEEEIDRLESLFSGLKGEVLPGENVLSAEIDVARSVSRRAERRLSSVSKKFGSDAMAKKYLNRLSDYLYVLARYTAVCVNNQKEAGITPQENVENPAALQVQQVVKQEAPQTSVIPKQEALKAAVIPTESEISKMGNANDALIQEVLRRVAAPVKLNLNQAKALIEIIENEAKRQGKQAVIAVCGPEGNPIAIHVMDDAFLVSFDVAMKKAYTSVAVKMSTMELSVLAQPGNTFYGVDKMDGGKIVIFGGGIPIKYEGRIIGGLGVSGGTGEEDHALAEFGLAHIEEVLSR